MHRCIEFMLINKLDRIGEVRGKILKPRWMDRPINVESITPTMKERTEWTSGMEITCDDTDTIAYIRDLQLPEGGQLIQKL